MAEPNDEWVNVAPAPADEWVDVKPAEDEWQDVKPALPTAPQQFRAVPIKEVVQPAPASQPEGLYPWSGAAKRHPTAAKVAGEVLKAVDPLGPIIDPLNSFKKHYLNPIIADIQEGNRMIAISGNPWEQQVGMQPKPGPLGKLRDTKPVASFVAENAGKLALGTTEVNAPGSEHPTAQEALRQLEYRGMGPTGTAAFQSFLREGSNLPLYLIGGAAGRGAAVEGATGGLLSAMLDPEVEDVEFAVKGGAVLGAGAQRVTEVVGKAVRDVATPEAFNTLKQTIKGMGPKPKTIVPVAVVPPEEVGKFAQVVANELPQVVVPSKGVPKDALAVVVARDVTNADKPRALALVQTPEGGLAAQPLDKTPVVPHGKGRDIPVIAEPGVGVPYDFNTPEADLRYPPPEPSFGIQRNIDISEWDATKGANQDVYEGLVLAIEGGDGQGTARLYDISDKTLQGKILRQRRLAEVDMGDGTVVRGFFSEAVPEADAAGRWHGARGVLLAPDPAEMIPGAAVTDVPVYNLARVSEFRSPTATYDILVERDALVKEAKAAADLADINIKAAVGDTSFAAPSEDSLAQQAGQGPLYRMGGGGMPPGGGPPPNAPPPPPQPNNINPQLPLQLRMWQAAENAYKYFTPRTVRGTLENQALAQQQLSLKAFESLGTDQLKSLQQKVPELAKMDRPQLQAARADLSAYMSGSLSQTDLLRRNPLLTAGAAQAVDAAQAEVARLQQQLSALGMGAGSNTDDIAAVLGLKGSDLADFKQRIYWRKLLPEGEWANVARRDRAKYNSLIADIRRDVYDVNPATRNMSNLDKTDLARRHLDVLLGDPKALSKAKVFESDFGAQLLKEAGESLKQTGDLRPWERQALGEIDDAFVRIAEATARLETQIVRGSLFKEVADNMTLSSAWDNRAAQRQFGHEQQVPNDPRKYGLLAGKNVHPDTWEALGGLDIAQNNANGFFAKLLNAWKWGSTVGNPYSWLNQIKGNLQNLAYSNLINPFSRPVRAGQGAVRWAQDYKAHLANPTNPQTWGAQRWRDGLRFGVIGSDFATAEFKASAKSWTNELLRQAKLTGGKPNFLDMLVDVARKGREVPNSIAEKYGAPDQISKYIAWEAGLEKGGFDPNSGLLDRVKAAKFLGSRYDPNMPAKALGEEVKREVSGRIHRSFPMMDRTSDFVKDVNKYSGLLNPFFKIKMEQLRTMGHIPGRMKSEPGMLGTMLLNFGVVVGTYFGLKALRESQGIDQRQVDAAWKTQPKAVQRYAPTSMTLWYRNEQGRMVSMDMSDLWEPLSYMNQTKTGASVTRNVLTNVAMLPFNGGIAEAPLVEVAATAGLLDPAYRRPEVAEWQREGATAAQQLLAKYGPSFFGSVYSTAERGGVGFTPRRTPVGEQQPQSALATAINLALGPGTITEAGNQFDKARTLSDARAEVRKAERELTTLARYRQEGQSMGKFTLPLDKEEALKRAEQNLFQKAQALEALEAELGAIP